MAKRTKTTRMTTVRRFTIWGFMVGENRTGHTLLLKCHRRAIISFPVIQFSSRMADSFQVKSIMLPAGAQPAAQPVGL